MNGAPKMTRVCCTKMICCTLDDPCMLHHDDMLHLDDPCMLHQDDLCMYVTVPGIVKKLVVSGYGPDWLTVEWEPPVEQNGVLQGYKIAFSHGTSSPVPLLSFLPYPLLHSPLSPHQQLPLYPCLYKAVSRNKVREILIAESIDTLEKTQ